ncbi:MAG: hypothetical protein HY717_17645 [Planctomycetes bacterium]|nr:hypothetical protein [Planctomycetota bacterium]
MNKRNRPSLLFWEWFADNAERLAEDSVVARQEVLDKLHKVWPDLDVTIGWSHGKSQLVLSAHGDKDQFPLIERIVANAPDIEGWVVTGLHPRVNPLVVSCGHGLLRPTDIRFRADHRCGLVDLTFFVMGLGGPNHESILKAAVVMVHFTLGEHDLAVKVGKMHFEPLAPYHSELPSLTKLHSLMDGVSGRTL